MPGIEDLRARQVAAALLKSADEATTALARAGFLGYPHDPADPTAWNDAGLFAAHRDLSAKIEAASQAGLDKSPFRFENCLSCRNFGALKSGRGDQPPEPIDGIVDTGYCTAHPPQRMNTNPSSDPLGSTMWPRVHGNHICGEWRPLTSPRGTW
jgi:hypothetical protein